MEQKYYWIFGILLLLILSLTIVFVQQNKTDENQIPQNQQNKTEWLNQLIEKEKSEPVANPPASIEKCLWKNQVVYVQSSRCCDIPFVVYSENGTILLSGCGFACTKEDQNFLDEKKDCEIVWKDTRSYP